MRNLYLILTLFFILSCDKKEEKYSEEELNQPTIFEGEAYGSTFRIVYYSYGKDLNENIEEIMNEFDQSVNTYKDDSYLSKFNKSEYGSAADKMLRDLIRISKEYNIKSNGYFDPSVASLSNLWGFYEGATHQNPKPYQIDSVMHFTGLSHTMVIKDSLTKDDARFKLNFNSITGYINDQIANYLNEKEIDNYMIEIGGEIFAKGKKLNGGKWTIGIDEPKENLAEREIAAAVLLDNQGLATSGNYRKFYIDENSNEKIVHTINPKTGEAKPSKLLSATIIAPTTAEADAMATATMAMGLENALEFVKQRNDLKFYLIWIDENQNINHKAFNGFEILKQD